MTIAAVRNMIVDSIVVAKAYEVPGLCSLVGLSAGEQEEAYRSKAQYVRVRLASMTSDQVLQVADRLVREGYASDQLQRYVATSTPAQSRLTSVTRKRILAVLQDRMWLTTNHTDDLAVLGRVWDLSRPVSPDYPATSLRAYLDEALRSDHSFTAADAVSCCGFSTCPEGDVARLLETIVHPEFWIDVIAQETVVALLNQALSGDDLALRQASTLSGMPVYKLERIPPATPADIAILETLTGFDANSVARRWELAIERRTTDPEGAVTLARTLLEDVCKWGLHRIGQEWSETDDLPALYKLLARALKLSSDGYSEEVFRSLLGSCSNIVTRLGELRNKAGDAHSTGPLRRKIARRHAEFAVNLAGATAQFLVATIEHRQSDSASAS